MIEMQIQSLLPSAHLVQFIEADFDLPPLRQPAIRTELENLSSCARTNCKYVK